MRGRIVLGALAVAFLIGFGAAWAIQEGEKQEAWRPPPPVEDAFLDSLVGEWLWTGTINLPDLGEMPYTATEKMKWAMNKQFLLSEYSAPMGPDDPMFEGLGLTRPTSDENEYEQWWFDISGKGLMMKAKLDGKTLSSAWECETGKFRSTMTVNEDGTGAYHHEVLYPGQTEWGTFFKVEGKKK